jgi:hypothetical protein
VQTRLASSTVPVKISSVFARHETFHPRFGWIKKGFDAAIADSGIFSREDAAVRLGVGKNMVRAIRYWCMAFKVLAEQDKFGADGEILSGLLPTAFGDKLLSDEGWDTFLEDPASLWLLHWQLLKSPNLATAWQFTFNHFRQVEFSVDDLFSSLCNYRENLTTPAVDSSLKKDITCLLRMYVESDAKVGANEDSLDCPFTELGLIAHAGDSKRYIFRVGAKSNLPDEVIVFACLEFAGAVGREQRTIALSRLAFDLDSPGMIFKLSESAMREAIAQVAEEWDEIEIRETAGLVQLSFTDDPILLAEDILNKYYCVS